MKSILVITLVLICSISLLTMTFTPAFAAKQSIFHSIADVFEHPFHSISKAIGGTGMPGKFSTPNYESSKLPSAFSSWLCQLFGWELEKITSQPFAFICRL